MSPNSQAPDALVERHARPGRSLVAILHAIQDDAGYVPPGCVAPLAKALNLSRAEVHGVLTYYHHFRTAP
ncbi:NAD(P)H-dependent oxidoreductase subunit E, partial [Burkholderia sp. MR1-5-21]